MIRTKVGISLVGSLVGLGCIVQPATTTHEPGRLGSPSSSGAPFSWLGMGTDVVGSGGQGSPNGQPDGHFQLIVPRDGDIASIVVTTSDAAGAPVGGQVWHTAEG